MGTDAPLTFRFGTPTPDLGLTEIRVTPGVIDDMARELFLYGMCHVLAMAIHEQTGWELAVAERQGPAGDWAWCHLGVHCPKDWPHFLDIEGRREPGEITRWLQQPPRRGNPVRMRCLSLAGWHEVIGAPAGAPASWWRTLFTSDADGRNAAMVDTFARVLVTAAAGAP
jgi:hypothetical protein